MEDQYGFTIDSSRVKEFSSGSYTSYTFLLNKRTDDKSVFENLVVTIDSTSAPKASIIKYHLNSEPLYISEDDAYAIDAQREITNINYNDDEARISWMGADGCTIVTIMCPFDYDHPAGLRCIAADRGDLFFSYDSSNCGGSGSGSGGGGPTGSPGGGPTGGSGGGGGNPNQGNNTDDSGSVIPEEEERLNGSTVTVPIIPGLNEGVTEKSSIQDILQLPTDSDEYNWLYHQATLEQLQDIDGFFEENGESQENKDSVNEAIEAYINNTVIVQGPDTPIDDISDYLDDFDSSQSVTITLYADQPDPSDPSDPLDLGGDLVGHAFVIIEQGSITRSFGFYPEDGVGYPNPTESTFGNDENHAYDVSVTLNNVSGNNILEIINLANVYEIVSYDLTDRNCTNFAMEAGIALFGSSSTFTLGDNTGSFIIGSGATPGMFGQSLGDMNLGISMTHDLDGGTAPANSN